MALGIYFAHEGLTTEKYETAIDKLGAAGAGAPKDRTLHVALETYGAIQVFDIWESQEDFEAFGSTLMPILEELGVGPKEPMVTTVCNRYSGLRSAPSTSGLQQGRSPDGRTPVRFGLTARARPSGQWRSPSLGPVDRDLIPRIGNNRCTPANPGRYVT